MNIAHARLPIGQYIQNMPTRKVLTVNQCYDILLQWVETKDWETAFYSVIVSVHYRISALADGCGASLTAETKV